MLRAIVNSLQTLEPTKRNIVGCASRFYDQLGFLSPVIIMLKAFFEELCKVKLDWDDQLRSVLISKWKELLSRFHRTVITLPRCYFHSEDKQNSNILYGFCVASTAAYTAVVYPRTGVDSTCFVAAKARVSPLNQLTIPRLELLSCLLLAKLISHVLEAITTVIDVRIGSCFTDSKMALYWIKGEGKQWKQFVHNRVTEIRRLVAVQHWSHCANCYIVLLLKVIDIARDMNSCKSYQPVRLSSDDRPPGNRLHSKPCIRLWFPSTIDRRKHESIFSCH